MDQRVASFAAYDDWSPTTDINSDLAPALEQGQVLFFPNLSFDLTAEERLLLTPSCVASKAKNVSFNPSNGKLHGVDADFEHTVLLQQLLSRYRAAVATFLKQCLPSYQASLQWGRSTFRPVEIAGRVSPSYRKDDTRLHVDAFPSKPNQGLRILRFFSNVNPHDDRVWRLGEPFAALLARFWPKLARYRPWQAALLHKFGITRARRSHYDHIMLQLHNQMKKSQHYQREVSQQTVAFPAASSWMVLTDQVSHAALKGQYVLEQTLHLPVSAMQQPALSPLKLIEKRLIAKDQLTA